MLRSHNSVAVILLLSVNGETWHVSPSELPNVDAAHQFRTVTNAAMGIAAGDTVLIHMGIYRESVVIERSGTQEHPISFAARNENVVIHGCGLADRLPREGENVSSVAWPYRFFPNSKTGAYRR